MRAADGGRRRAKVTDALVQGALVGTMRVPIKGIVGTLAGASFLVTCLVTWLYVGRVYSYLDDELQKTYFIKKFASFQIEFHDPYASEADPVPVAQLTGEQRRDFADYCKYRFGIESTTDDSLEACRRGLPNSLANRIGSTRTR